MISNRMRLFGLVVLTFINLFNYVDRFIVSALLPFIQRDMNLSDAQLGFLHTAFTLGYLLFAPFLGFLGDRMSRRVLASASVFLWSIATAFSARAGTLLSLQFVRAAVGIGEAGYGPVAPTLITDYYSRELRSRMLSVYFISIPLGTAFGIVAGGYLGHHYGWRAAFVIAAAPGLVLAILALMIPDPPRTTIAANPKLRGTIRYLSRTASYRYNLLGTAALTFATGGIGFWFPTFLSRVRGFQIRFATQSFGATTVVAGIAGTIFGGFVADLWQVRNRRSYFYVSAIGMLISVPLALISILLTRRIWLFPFVFLTEFFLFFNIGPLNAAIISVVQPRMRATAMAVNILFIHILGDAISPAVIGKISDATGSLTLGMLIAVPAILIGGLILLLGAEKLAQDQVTLESMQS